MRCVPSVVCVIFCRAGDVDGSIIITLPVVSMGICLKLNKIITLMIVALAALWFLLVVVLPESGHVLSGPREK